MWYRPALVSTACLVVLVFALPVDNVGPALVARGQEKLPARAEPLVDKVRVAIQRGVQFLKDQEKSTGNWEKDSISADGRFATGESSLAMLALLNAGLPPTDPVIQRGLEYLRGKKLENTYVISLQTMVFALAGQDKDRERIQDNVKWLIDARVLGKNGELLGWTYGKGTRLAGADASNTQYALLALHDGHQLGGARVPREVWEQVRKHYKDSQNEDGGWGYTPGRNSILTMTTAGLCGLYIASSELNDRRENLNKDGTAEGCGIYDEDKHLKAGHEWLARQFTPEHRQAIFYSLYGLERTGRLSGKRFLGDHDWYRAGCEYLVRTQSQESGSWHTTSPHDAWPIVSTSFALLFLSKGRTPILITKFQHGEGNDWNNDRYDVRNLTDFASKEMFKRTPLAWQVWETKRARIENEAQLLDATAELVQSPILYISGHKALDLTDNEEKLLKEYVNNGGFIYAEACCGKKEFADSFRALVKKLFLDDLVPLEDAHPIWRSWAPVKPDSCPFKLEGLQQGCKTIVVLSPQDMSCLFEANQRETPRGQLAFRLGGNIIAYATGMEIPKPRLTPGDVTRAKEDPKQIPRGFLKVAQVKHNGDWQPAPKAMRNLMEHLRQKAGLDVTLQTEPLSLGDAGNVADFKFFYVHGRKEFSIADDSVANLRANLQTGGILLADACCGNKNFDRSFRAFMEKVFPDQKLERIPLTDDLFSKDLNGEAIKTVRCRVEGVGGAADKEYKELAPNLEGVKIDGHWVVIYSKYDLGCALEKRPSPDCLGHDHASAIKLASAAVLYALKR